MIIFVALVGVDVMLGKIGIISHVFDSSFIRFSRHSNDELWQGRLRHSDVTRSLFEADTTLPQSTKHLKLELMQQMSLMITMKFNCVTMNHDGRVFFF